MDDQAKQWVNSQLSDAVYELMEKGVFDEALIEAKPAWALPKSLVIGKARIKGNVNHFYWILAGDAPTMCIESKLADTPRLAMRHFAYAWQRNIGLDTKDKEAEVQKAEALTQLTEIDELWAS